MAPFIKDQEHNNTNNNDFWFPGRWIGGISLCIAPVVFLTGILLRLPFHFFFPQQLAAFKDYPVLIIASYNCFVIGNILMWPAIITLATLIGKRKPQLALWGGSFVIFGLFARTFHAGVDHLAFQLVRVQGLDTATKAIADAYGGFNIIATFNGTIMLGWVILATGAYLSGVLPLIRSILLALMCTLMLGVLKGSSIISVVAAVALCIAFVPLGIGILKDGPKPSYRVIALSTMLILTLTTLLYFFGQLG
ncbi:MAG: hypothetical protein QM802_08790 [Agriterribacter sp.]